MHAYYGTFYVDTDEYQLATKSFVDGAFQFIMILPKEGVDATKAIPEIYNFEKYVNMGMKSVNLELFLPKFTSDYTENNLFNYLANINPTLKFLQDDMSFFEDINEDTGLAAIQKTFFLVDEEGAEAAAVSDIMNVTAPGPSIQIENAYMRLDRPFFYAIVESNTQCPLFIGYYGN